MRKLYAVQKMEMERAEHEQTTLLDMSVDEAPIELTSWDVIAKLDSDEFNDSNLFIAEGCSYSLNDMKTRLNNNVLVVGGSNPYLSLCISWFKHTAHYRSIFEVRFYEHGVLFIVLVVNVMY
ncbi:MAG: hypothetical protein J6K17_08270 [Oscillospiraceae bacterium]|nr:hypothetical protein [Oscillospiraceae bacterium]